MLLTRPGLRRWRTGAAVAVLLMAEGHTEPGQEFWIVSVTSPPEQRVAPGTGAPVSPVKGRTTVTRHVVPGAFAVLKETYTAPHPIKFMGPSRWTRIHLSIAAPDRRVHVTLTDDGRRLSVTAESPSCFVVANWLQYTLDDRRELYAAMAAALRTLVDACGAELASPRQVRTLLERAKPDFPRAFRTWKADVRHAFGPSRKRCARPEPGMVVLDAEPCG